MTNADYCQIRRIQPHPANVRENLGDLTELTASIKVHGILQPLVVRPHPNLHGMFVILAGHRRLEAAKLAGLEEVPIVIRQGGPLQDVEIMLIENCQRSDLSAVEKAEAMGALRNRGLSNAEIARRTGLSQSTVGYYVSLLELDESSRRRIQDGQIRVGEAIEAVRLRRQRVRKTAGRALPNAHWEPPHFTAGHPLAGRAATMCDAREHTMRRRIGGTACGQCWETVIRADERTVAATLQEVNP